MEHAARTTNVTLTGKPEGKEIYPLQSLRITGAMPLYLRVVHTDKFCLSQYMHLPAACYWQQVLQCSELCA